ncbi:MAG: response regulator [Campylobacterales bacterium]
MQVVDDRSFKVIFEKANCGIAYGDSSGKLILCNSYFANMTGYTKDEIESMNFAELTHPDDITTELPLFEEIASQKRDGYRLQKRYIRKNGEIIWVDLATSVIRDENGRALNYLGVVIDITKEKFLEDEIKQKERRFRDVTEASGEYIWELNSDGEYIFITKPFEDMLGYSIEEGLGRTPFSFMPLDEQKRVGEYFINEVANKGVSFRGLIHRSMTKDGRIVWQKVNGLPMFDNDGSIIGYRGAALDITFEKKAQEELEAAKAKAEAANRAKTEFLANMSHEIRTPMNAVIGLGDILGDMIEEPKQKDILHKINSSSKMLLGVINDVLDYSKIEAGKLELDRSSFHIDKVLSNLKVMFEEKASSKGLELYFYPKGEKFGLLLGDELRLTQVLTNLLSNAIKFTHKGIITLTIEPLKTLEEEKITLSFSVEDSGIGMEKEQIKKLFKPFSQADSSTTRKYGGTGLGLVISKKIINAMGGDIEVESRVGVGTKFSFILEFDLVACDTFIDAQHTPNTKVLIVDDQSISREVLRSMLERFNYSLDEASNGLEAIELIEKSDRNNTPYEIMFIDWNMPLLNGVDTLQKLQNMYEEKKLTSKIPTVFMVSGYSKEDIPLDKINIDSFISKPFTSSSLFDAIIDVKGGRSKKITLPENNTTNMSGISVLIVEDNEVNQEVVSMMLQKVGIEYEIANNGQEGVDKFLSNQSRYDLVLMDLQMPIMSGYDATKKIREVNQEIPIIALSAAAMTEDKERALEAGMDEHISKPIDKHELYRTISRFCNSKLDEQAILDRVDEQTQSNNLLLKFKKQLKDGEFKDIVEVVEKNAPNAKERVHTLKGVSGNLGANELCEILTHIDTKYKKQEKIEDDDIQNLSLAKAKLLEDLEQLQENEPKIKNQKKLTTDELHTLFEEVKELLKEGELVEDNVVDRLYVNLTSYIAKEELEKWKELVEEFEFEKAYYMMDSWDFA